LPENQERYLFFLMNPKGIAKSTVSVTATLCILMAASTEDSLYKAAQS
jgi:hypothetical protein